MPHRHSAPHWSLTTPRRRPDLSAPRPLTRVTGPPSAATKAPAPAPDRPPTRRQIRPSRPHPTRPSWPMTPPAGPIATVRRARPPKPAPGRHCAQATERPASVRQADAAQPTNGCDPGVPSRPAAGPARPGTGPAPAPPCAPSSTAAAGPRQLGPGWPDCPRWQRPPHRLRHRPTGGRGGRAADRVAGPHRTPPCRLHRTSPGSVAYPPIPSARR